MASITRVIVNVTQSIRGDLLWSEPLKVANPKHGM